MPTFNKSDMLDCAGGYHDFSDDAHSCRVSGHVSKPVDAPDGIANASRYDAELNRLQLAPNGDDYNAIMEMLGGAPYRTPHVKGR
ncbi:hypothetical protein [Mesorhizobium sp. ANAO-SY3R2]|uniref:hypothetical protein n=1 Tax=Mesorhizobium sp. ANAO-SY3R2 TaxID=3166644 RepID=UPI00366C5F3D